MAIKRRTPISTATRKTVSVYNNDGQTVGTQKMDRTRKPRTTAGMKMKESTPRATGAGKRR